MANEIIIEKNGVSVKMPRIRDITFGGTEEAKTVKVAGGRIVKDVIGFRPTVTAVWDWVPAKTIRELTALLQQGGFFRVTYPSPEGRKTGSFSIGFIITVRGK